MDSKSSTAPTVREDVLRDPHHPVHRIADKLLPYLRVLVEQFHPEQVILFGSYAYGQPDEHSDVDLLVVKEIHGSALKEKLRIRKAWNSLHAHRGYLSIHVLVESPETHIHRLSHAAGFYDNINVRGLALL